MKKNVRITIDGQEIYVPPGMILLDVAEQAGIKIPNLCYLKGMKGIGACRLCLVEIDGLKAPVMSCNTRVKEGMIVRTKTEKLIELRRFVIELLLSMHPNDCLTCTKAGICELQNYAYELGVKETTFTKKRLGYSADDTNPFIKRQPDYCIFCSRCIRICQEQGTAVLNFMGRGIESKVTTANDKPLKDSQCTFCGSCIDVCPVNAIVEADREQKGREWEYDKIKSVCLFCGCGCDIISNVKNGKIEKINPAANRGSIERYICAYGRFGFDWLYGDKRIRVPLKRINGSLKEVSWSEAISFISENLKKYGKETGFITTSNLLNEDILVLKKFVRDVVGSEYFGATFSLYTDTEYLAKSQCINIEEADLIILADMNPSQKERLLPALDVYLRRKASRGAKIVTINSSYTDIGKASTLNLINEPELTVKQLLKALISKGFNGNKEIVSLIQEIEEVSEDINKLADFIIEAVNPVIITSPKLFKLLSNIDSLKGKIVCPGLEANCMGIAKSGINGGKTFEEIINSDLKILYVIGEVPINSRPNNVDLLVVQNSHFTDLSLEADIVLPSTTFFETSGTIIDWMGRMKHLQPVVNPYGQAKNHREIFISIAKGLGITLNFPTSKDLRRLINGKAKGNTNRIKDSYSFDINSPKLIELLNNSLFTNSNLIWLKQQKKGVSK